MTLHHDHRITYYSKSATRTAVKWFLMGFTAGLVIFVTMFVTEANASTKRLPPAWRTWLEVCSREQPKPGVVDVTKWTTPNWHQTHNYSFPGGCGMTVTNYEDIRRKHWPDSMDKATPLQQLWACHFLYWKYARIGQRLTGSYEGGQRYGSTVWDVHTHMGWYGFLADGKTWQ